MTYLIHSEGNLFDSTARAIGQGVNTQGVMGAGIALEFKRREPEMYEAYRKLCREDYFVGGMVFPWGTRDGKVILNIASQEQPGANAEYGFLWAGVRKSLKFLNEMGIDTLALPRIGSGIGGLNEKVVEGILYALASESPVNIELWTYKP